MDTIREYSEMIMLITGEDYSVINTGVPIDT